MTDTPRRPTINRRSVLKAFGAGAAAPLAMGDALALPSQPMTAEIANIEAEEWGNLFLVENDKPIWGPGIESITRTTDHSKDQSIPLKSGDRMVQHLTFRPLLGTTGFSIKFNPWSIDRTMIILGSQLIHKPTRTKYDPFYFSSAAHVVSGDHFIITHNVTL